MGDLIAVDDVVVPISLSGVHDLRIEAECASPGSRLGRLPTKRKIGFVAVPRSDEMDGLTP